MNSPILKAIVIGLVLFASIFLGSLVGQQSFEELSLWTVVVLVVWYCVAGWKLTWSVALLLIFSGVTVQQGFAFGGNHLTIMMVAFATGLSALNRDIKWPTGLIRSAGIGQLKLWIGLFLVYGVLHFIYNYVIPFEPDEYSAGNAAKAYFATFSSFVLMLWLVAGPYEFRMKENWLRTFWHILAFAVIVNTIIMALMVKGGLGKDSLSGDPTAAERLSYYIPVVNVALNRFTLRILGAESVFLVALFMINRQAWHGFSRWLKIILIITAISGLVGAVLSGGRAVVILAILFSGLALFKNRRVGVIFVGVVTAVLLILVVNIFSRIINEKASPIVARSVQLVMIEKGESYDTIKGSDRSREESAEAGWVEWNSDPRIFLTGRTVYRYLGDKTFRELRGTIGSDEAFAYYAVRAGAVHNLYGELAIQYGLAGMVLYTLAILSVMFYCIKLYRKCRLYEMPPAVCELSFFCAATVPVFFIQAIFGGGYLSPLIPVLIGIIRAQIGKEERAREHEAQRLEVAAAQSFQGILR